MPTGYTAPIYEGKEITFPEFAMQCARAFGALITMRDEPADAPVPEDFTPDTYHSRELAKARASLADMQSWDDGRWEREAAKAYTEAVAYARKRNAESAALRQRYEAMLAQVQAWEPPSADHRELKTFMTEQLAKSVECDCWEADVPVAIAASEYRNQQIAAAQRSVEYHAREHDAEVFRAIGRSEWLRDLRASLRAEAGE